MLWFVTYIHVDRFAVLLTVSRSFNITLLQFGERFRASNTTFFASLFVYPSATRRAKICQWSVAKRKRRIQNIELFLSSPVINYGRNYKAIEKGTSIIIRLLGSYKSVIKPKNQWIYAKNSCCVHLSLPCAPRTRKPQLYEQLFRSCMAFSVYEVVRVACQSHS